MNSFLPLAPPPTRWPARVQPFLVAPFDALRRHYAGAVAAGIVPRSLRASARLEQGLHALESLLLGPLARRR